ncbi:phosphatase [Sinorhizobium fredii]|uniref:Phosphatase n=1 Tax=Rhizobium fredii TaxID=380 RepID=A0A2A6M6I5_RHIFR|nr:metallophosphoesterase [Sinorhizobium fredii]PDT50157.1 phosphatase [Sinorhizobium fredii]
MRLWVISDLHTEFAPFAVPRPLPRADACVVAGDFGVGGITPALTWLHRNIAPAMDLVFVAGNHDYYRTAYVEALREGREAASRLPGVHFLENDTVTLDSVTFVGCTLWTDFALNGHQELAMFDARTGMNDYKRIKFAKRPFARFTPERTVRTHLDSRAYLERVLAAANGKTVVVTHHAPSRLSIPEHLASDRLSAAYASNLDDLMLKFKPALWIHGHIHDPVDYLVGGTRVLSNPVGYPGERLNGSSYRGMIVEV